MYRKSIFYYLLIFFPFIVSCSSDGSDKGNNMSELYKGSFVSVAHQTIGSVSINKEKTILSFTNFMTDNGPNLDIYLVENIENVTDNYLDLGNLQGINGNYSYSLPNNIDYSVYKYVVVWCTDFSVNFGYATLIEL